MSQRFGSTRLPQNVSIDESDSESDSPGAGLLARTTVFDVISSEMSRSGLEINESGRSSWKPQLRVEPGPLAVVVLEPGCIQKRADQRILGAEKELPIVSE